MDKETLQDTSVVQQDDLYNKKIEPITPPSPQIGIDLTNDLITTLIDNAVVSQADASSLESFTNSTRTRNELYDILDYMAQDTTLASVLENYAEDATEMNDQGNIVWCESDEPEVLKYITFLLKSLNVDKNVFKWTNSLCKYGDVYLRLYRESEVEDKFFNNRTSRKSNKKTSLNEDLTIAAYQPGDRYIHYLEQAPNPAQLFELTRFGKTAGYIKTNIKATPVQNTAGNTYYNNNLYKFNSASSDVELYPATEWVHGCLEDNSSRCPEEVELFESEDAEDKVVYTVKRGESLLYDSYKTWRELMLLENSVLLQRVTQSSIVRVIGVEVGDMPKESVQPHLMSIKQLIEQRAALNVGNSMSEYTNPGPIVNNIYIPTRNNQGVLSTQQIGGDVNIGELLDLEYYENKLFGGLRVPKQYFGRTDDAAGFSGGQSLSLMSSRYAKMIKRIQNVIIQMITDAINLILIDTHNDSYINRFKIRMLSPTTQEEVDRRDNLSTKVALVSDIMTSLSDIEDVATRLKILKSLLSDTIANSEVMSLIEEEITRLGEEASAPIDPSTTDDDDIVDEIDFTSGASSNDLDYSGGSDLSDLFNDTPTSLDTSDDTSQTDDDDMVLPSPQELNIGDVSDANNPNL